MLELEGRVGQLTVERQGAEKMVEDLRAAVVEVESALASATAAAQEAGHRLSAESESRAAAEALVKGMEGEVARAKEESAGLKAELRCEKDAVQEAGREAKRLQQEAEAARRQAAALERDMHDKVRNSSHGGWKKHLK